MALQKHPRRFLGMIIARWFPAAVACIGCSWSAVAVDRGASQPEPGAAAPSRVLSWEDCVGLAKTNSAALATARQEVALAEERLREADSLFLPQVSARLSHDLSAEAPGREETHLYSASVSASQNIFNGNGDRARHSQLQTRVTMARENLRAASVVASHELMQSFQNLLFAYDSAGLSEEISRRRRENVRLVELRFNSGLENRGSLLLAQAYLQQAQLESRQAERDKRLAKAQLTELIGIPADRYEIKGAVSPLADAIKDGTAPIDYANAASVHPQYLSAAAEQEASAWDIQVADAVFYPTVDLSASYGAQDREFFPDDGRRLSLQLGVNVPIFNGGRDVSRAKQAIIGRVSASQRAEDLRRGLVVELERSFGELQQSQASVELEETFKAASTVRAEIARGKYDNGLLSFEDWDLIENDLINREKSVRRSLHDLNLAAAAWLRALGKEILQ